MKKNAVPGAQKIHIQNICRWLLSKLTIQQEQDKGLI